MYVALVNTSIIKGFRNNVLKLKSIKNYKHMTEIKYCQVDLI